MVVVDPSVTSPSQYRFPTLAWTSMSTVFRSFVGQYPSGLTFPQPHLSGTSLPRSAPLRSQTIWGILASTLPTLTITHEFSLPHIPTSSGARFAIVLFPKHDTALKPELRIVNVPAILLAAVHSDQEPLPAYILEEVPWTDLKPMLVFVDERTVL